MDFLDAVGGDESVVRIDRAHRVRQLGSPGKVVLERPCRCRAAGAVPRAGRRAPAGSADAHPGTGASRSSISAFTLIAQPANAGRPVMGPIHEPTTEGASTYAWRLRLPGRVFRTRGGQWECRVAVTGSIRFYIRRGVIRSLSRWCRASGCRRTCTPQRPLAHHDRAQG